MPTIVGRPGRCLIHDDLDARAVRDRNSGAAGLSRIARRQQEHSRKQARQTHQLVFLPPKKAPFQITF
jgi:hypothetical protein